MIRNSYNVNVVIFFKISFWIKSQIDFLYVYMVLFLLSFYPLKKNDSNKPINQFRGDTAVMRKPGEMNPKQETLKMLHVVNVLCLWVPDLFRLSAVVDLPRNAQIADLQQKVLAADGEVRLKQRIDGITSIVDAKCALRLLMSEVKTVGGLSWVDSCSSGSFDSKNLFIFPPEMLPLLLPLFKKKNQIVGPVDLKWWSGDPAPPHVCWSLPLHLHPITSFFLVVCFFFFF